MDQEMLVMYPAPGLGHLVPLVELSKRIIVRHPSLYITFLVATLPVDYNTDAATAYIASVSSTYPSVTFHSLPTVALQHDPTTYTVPEDMIFELLRINIPNVHKALLSLSISSRISAFIIDFFCSAALDLGKSLNIPTYYFFISGVSALALFLEFPHIDKTTVGPFQGSKDHFSIPGLPLVPATRLLEPMLNRGITYKEFIYVGEHLAKSEGVIVNTFSEFEHRAAEALHNRDQTPPVYCVGPLVSTEDTTGSSKTRHDCLTWLDSQPSLSVVFLCFGSLGFFQKDQLKEIAEGLERSMQRFIWMVRDPPPLDDVSKRFTKPPDPDLDTILPVGFMDRTKGRGLVVKSWAPQKAILSHGSIGAFVTHCGWNSTLEAVCAGVPLLAWPLFAEQKFNQLVLVDGVKVALPVEEVEEGAKFVTADEVERRVREIMESKEGEEVRKRMLDMKVKAKIAMDEGGSSTLALDKLVDSFPKR